MPLATRSVSSEIGLNLHPVWGDIPVIETDMALADRFTAVSALYPVIDYIAEHNPKSEFPDLGVLAPKVRIGDSTFFGDEGESIAPMGANEDVLFGCFGLRAPSRSLLKGLYQGDVVDIWGKPVRIGLSRVAYTVLNRNKLSVGDFGSIRYSGKVAIFSSVPHDMQLQDFAKEVVPGTSTLKLARIDKTVLDASLAMRV